MTYTHVAHPPTGVTPPRQHVPSFPRFLVSPPPYQHCTPTPQDVHVFPHNMPTPSLPLSKTNIQWLDWKRRPHNFTSLCEVRFPALKQYYGEIILKKLCIWCSQMTLRSFSTLLPVFAKVNINCTTERLFHALYLNYTHWCTRARMAQTRRQWV